jgi:hypothetical protein
MKNEILFSESQRFKKPWLLAIIFGVNGFFIYAFIQQVVFHKTIGDKPMSDNGLLLALLLCSIITILILSVRLKTIIQEDALYVQFFQLQLRYKKYEWSTISKIYVREYNPIFEYGGWGYRWMFGGGKAYTISGNKGIQIVFENESKLLIGTSSPEEVEIALNQIQKK